MERELKIILDMVKQKTNIDIDVFSKSNDFIASTREAAIKLSPPPIEEIYEVISDENKGKTFFSFNFQNEKLTGVIDGSGDVEKNYAYLFMAMFEGAEKEDNASFGDQLKSILLGDYSRQQIQKFMNRYSVPDARCFALAVACADGNAESVKDILSDYLSKEYDSVTVTDESTVSFIKFVSEGEEVDPVGFANSIFNALKTEAKDEINVGVSGIVSGFTEVNNAYLQATNALRMSKVLSANAGVQSYKDYMLVKMLEDLPKFKLNEYLNQLISKDAEEIFRDKDMLLTAESFFKNNLNVSETARNLFMHRNTLIYRIDKILKETDLDIKKFSDALTFNLIVFLMKIVE